MTAATGYKRERFYTRGLAAALLAVITAPVFVLYARALWEFIFDKDFSVPGINTGLLGTSIMLSLESTLLCTVMGAMAALFIWRFKGRTAFNLLAFLLISALIPHFIHVHSWIKTIDFINVMIQDMTPFSPNFTGRGAVIWTTAMTYLPFTAAFCYLGFKSVPAEIIDLIKTEDDPVRSFTGIIMRFCLPFLFTGMIFVFLITINDFAISSVFGVNVYALELFALFSAGGDIHSIALAGLPLLMISVILLIFFTKLASGRDFKDDFTDSQTPYRSIRITIAGGAVLVVFAAVPLIAMIAESFKTNEILKVLSSSAGQIFYSFVISMLTAVIASLPAALYSYLRSRTGGGHWVNILLAVPFLIPSAILGLSLISFWNNSFLACVYSSAVMPAIGLAVRFGVIAVLFMSYRFNRISKEITDSLKLDASGPGGFFRVILPMMLKDITACIMMIFALAMGEYGVVLMLTPPGYQMVTIKIYNYIHYGASEIVFTLNMTVFISVLLAGLIIIRLYRMKGRKR